MVKSKTAVRGFDQKIIGFIEINERNEKIVRDFGQRILGKYDPKRDLTLDFYGRIVARGDQTGMLFSLANK